MKKRKKGYFEFRLIKPKKCTTKNKIKVKVKILDKGFVENLRIMFYHFDKIAKKVNIPYERKEETKTGFTRSVYVAEFTLAKSGVYWFYFTLYIEGQKYYVMQNEKYLTHKKTNEYPNECCWRLEVKDANLKEHPEWTGRTIYQLMPDRFAIGKNGIIPVEGRKIKDWNDRMPDWKPDEDGIYRNEYFYGGNLDGVTQKIPYLKELGFDTIYMCPVFKSKTYHHYDPEDYFEIDPMLGTEEDYERLNTALHENGMKNIGDMVFNHSSEQHPYFQSAVLNPKSPYREYYKQENGKFVNWSIFNDMKEFDKSNFKFKEEAKRILKKYIYYGMDSVRFDLGENFPKDFMDYIGTLKYIYPELIFTNEMWQIATEKYNPQILDGQADSVMNYPMADAILRWVRTGNWAHFQYRFEKIYGEYPKEVQDRLMNVLSTHDTPTAITMLVGRIMNEDPYTGGDIWDIEEPWRYRPDFFDTFGFREFEATYDELSPEERKIGEKRLKLAIAIDYILAGNPCLFMGTENAESGYKDPFCRKPMNWDNPNISMQQFVKSMGEHRKAQKEILAQGESRLRKCTENLLVLERYVGRRSLILVVNRTEVTYKIHNLEAYEVIFSENSTKDKIGEYGTLILRRDK